MTELVLKLVLEHGLEDWTDWATYKRITILNTNLLNYGSDPSRLQGLKIKIRGEEFKTYTEDGNLLQAFFKKRGLVEGVFTGYSYLFRTISRKSTYRRGKKEGIEHDFYPSEELQSIQIYKANALHGACDAFYENGILKSREFYKNGSKDGLSSYFFTNGTIKEKTFYKNSKRDGLSEFYYDNGCLKVRSYFQQGLLEGPSTSYFLNGNIAHSGYYEHGVPHGEQINYFKSGSKKRVFSWKFGKLNGMDTTYFKNGTIHEICFWNDNNMEGLHSVWYHDEKTKEGRLKYSTMYKNDKRDGERKKFSPNGSLLFHHIYENGIRVKVIADSTKQFHKPNDIKIGYPRCKKRKRVENEDSI